MGCDAIVGLGLTLLALLFAVTVCTLVICTGRDLLPWIAAHGVLAIRFTATVVAIWFGLIAVVRIARGAAVSSFNLATPAIAVAVLFASYGAFGSA